MPRGNRNLYIAIGVVALVAVLIAVATWPQVPRLQSYSYENPRSEHYRPGGSKCKPTALSSIRNVRRRTSQADKCAEQAEEYRLSTNDLIQQTRAADAAKAGADIASQGLWTAWFQATAGFITLAAAIAAAYYARDAAAETRRGANLSEEVRTLEYRPWVTFTLKAISGIQPEPHRPGIQNIFCEVALSNIGKSPATSVVATIGTAKHADFNDIEVPKGRTSGFDAVGQTLLPGQQQPQNGFASGISANSYIEAQQTIVLVTAYYKSDVTGRDHLTRACFMIQPSNGTDERGRPIPVFERMPTGSMAT